MNNKKKLIEHLSQFITHNKYDKMRAVVENRTRHLTVVLEDLFQPHNASAVLRSADIFGIQDVHVIEARNKFKVVSDVAMGSSQWLDVHPHASTTAAIERLRSQGYRIVATTPHTDSCFLPELPVDQKIALFFGTELKGLSDEALQQADMFVKIPMYGFVESFNVSVSVALCLYDIVTKLRNSAVSWQLSRDEKDDIMLAWIRKISKTAAKIEVEALNDFF